MSLIASATLTLGAMQYDAHMASIDVTLALLPGANSFSATLPAGAQISAAPGDPASLELENGDQAPAGPAGALGAAAGGLGGAFGAGAASTKAVITGKIRAFRRSLPCTRVVVADGGADLAQLRPAATYERQNAQEVVRALASDAGAEIGTIDLDLPLAAYVAHQWRTAAEQIAYLARLAGASASFDGAGKLQVAPWPEAQPGVALRYGREIVEYAVRERPAPPARRIMAGNGPAGAADAPDALRPTVDMLPAGAPAAGAGAVWRAAAILRTPQAAQTASQAASDAATVQASTLRARCFLLPDLRPGAVIEIQDLPEGLPGGPWMLTRVTHRLAPGTGGVTILEGQLAGASGADSLLGAALGAIGGLL